MECLTAVEAPIQLDVTLEESPQDSQDNDVQERSPSVRPDQLLPEGTGTSDSWSKVADQTIHDLDSPTVLVDSPTIQLDDSIHEPPLEEQQQQSAGTSVPTRGAELAVSELSGRSSSSSHDHDHTDHQPLSTEPPDNDEEDSTTSNTPLLHTNFHVLADYINCFPGVDGFPQFHDGKRRTVLRLAY